MGAPDGTEDGRLRVVAAFADDGVSLASCTYILANLLDVVDAGPEEV
jgi:hypothetical protein